MRIAQALPIFLACTLPALNCVAETVLAGEAARESPYYTGSPGAATITRRTLPDWLQYRKDNGLVEDNAIARQAFVIDDPILLDDIHVLANQLLASWPGTAPEIAIFLKNGSPHAYGGEVTGANEVLVEIGTLVKARSLDAVASVLAHELSHILLGHNITDQYIKEAQSLARGFAEAQSWTKGLEALNVTANDNTVNVTVDPRYQSDLLKIRKREELANRFYRTVHASVFSRANEKEADMLAVDLLVAAGFSPAGTIESFDELAAAYTFTDSVAVSMKEAADKSRAEIEKYAESQLSEPSQLTTSGLQAGLREVGSALRRQVTATVVKLAESRHPVPDSRRAEFLEYIGSEYNVLQRNKAVQTEPLNALRAKPEIERLLERNRLAMEAFERALDDPAGASGLLRGQDAMDPFSAYVTYNVHSMLAAREQAVAAIAAIESFSYLTDSSTVEMADFLTVGARDEARRTLASAIIAQKETYFGLVPEFYPAKIALARGEGDAETARRLANDCVDDFAEREELRRRCAPFADPAQAPSDKESPLDKLRRVPRLLGR